MTGRLDLFQVKFHLPLFFRITPVIMLQFAVRRFLENPNFVQLYRRRGVEKENPSIYSIIVNCAGMTPVQINEVCMSVLLACTIVHTLALRIDCRSDP